MITGMSAAPDETSPEPRQTSAGAWLTITFSIALLLNAIDAWTDPDSGVWRVLRWTVSIAFALALLWRIYTKVRERRQTLWGTTPPA